MVASVYNVFISSTSKDLTKYRAKVKEAVLRAGAFPIAMEEFEATERNALQLCYDEVQKADIFIGIYAHRYGYAPSADSTFTIADGEERSGDGETGITHLEYLWALERKLPMLLYVVSDKSEDGDELAWPPSQIEAEPGKSRMAAFKALIMGKHVVGFFYSPDHLAAQISSALPKVLAEQSTKLTDTAPIFEPIRYDFYKHVPLPPNYVPRASLLDELRLVLLGDAASIALTADKAKPTALHGMGGIGKSVMARALCELPEMQAAFPDGILWTVLGQNVSDDELRVKLRDWVTTLNGQISENAPTLEKLKSTLVTLLEKKACLLIVDDAWQCTHAEWFKVGGTKCRLLITTRDTEIAKELGAEVQPIPLMAMPEAVALLDLWSDGQLTHAPEALKERIAQRLGRLPLALKLAGAQLQYDAPEPWLQTFDARMLEGNRINKPHDSLALTFQLSINQLKPTTRQVYAALCIFKEDEPIHEAGVRKLWNGLVGWNDKLTERELRDLAARALLDLVQLEYPRAVLLHDLLRDHMAAELSEKGIKVIELHRKVLDAYHSLSMGTGWHTVPDDGYLYDHLVYHLKATGDYPELKRLFDNHEWLHVRIPQSDYTYEGYIADVMTAWQDFAHPEALRQIEADSNPTAFADCVRYALIRTSINSLAANYVPELVARAVELGLWTAKRALSVAENVPNAEQKAKLYILLLQNNSLNEAEHGTAIKKGLASVISISSEQVRVKALVALSSHLIGEAREQALALGLIAVTSVKYEHSRADALVALTPYLTGKLLTQGLTVAFGIQNARYRAKALVALLPYLSGEAREHASAQGLLAALATPNEEPLHFNFYDGSHANILALLIPYVTGSAREQALTEGVVTSLAFQDDASRAKALVALLPYLIGATREQALTEGLTAAFAIPDEGSSPFTSSYDGSREDALIALLPFLDEEARELVLAKDLVTALAIQDDQPRAKALTALVPYLVGEARERALREGLVAALVIRNDSFRADALIPLLPYLAGEARDHALMEGLVAALAIEYAGSRTDNLRALLPYLVGEARERALEEGLMSALAVREELVSPFFVHSERPYVTALQALAPNLTHKLLSGVLAVALIIQDDMSRTFALVTLIPHLIAETRVYALAQGLRAAISTQSQDQQGQAFIALVPHTLGEMHERVLAQALEAALAFDDIIKAKALLLKRDEKSFHLTQLIKEINQAARAPNFVSSYGFRYEVSRELAIAVLAPYLTDELLRQTLNTVFAFENEFEQASILTVLAPYLTGELLKQTLTAVFAFEDKSACTFALAALTPYLTDKLILQRLGAVHAIEDKWQRALALTALIPRLSGEAYEHTLAAGLAAVHAIEDEWQRVSALIALIPYLDEQARKQALIEGLVAANSNQNEEIRAKTLIALAPHLTVDLLQQVLIGATTFQNEEYRADVLQALAPHLTGELLSQALDVALAIQDKIHRARILVALSPYLLESARSQALAHGLEAASAIEAENYQAWMLASFLPVIDDHSILIRKIRQALTGYLLTSEEQKRESILELFAEETLFTPEILSSAILETIAHHIIEICNEWQWV